MVVIMGLTKYNNALVVVSAGTLGTGSECCCDPTCADCEAIFELLSATVTISGSSWYLGATCGFDSSKLDGSYAGLTYGGCDITPDAPSSMPGLADCCFCWGDRFCDYFFCTGYDYEHIYVQLTICRSASDGKWYAKSRIYTRSFFHNCGDSLATGYILMDTYEGGPYDGCPTSGSMSSASSGIGGTASFNLS